MMRQQTHGWALPSSRGCSLLPACPELVVSFSHIDALLFLVVIRGERKLRAHPQLPPLRVSYVSGRTPVALLCLRKAPSAPSQLLPASPRCKDLFKDVEEAGGSGGSGRKLNGWARALFTLLDI